VAVAAKIQVVWLSVKRVQLLEFYTRPLHDLLVQFGFFISFFLWLFKLTNAATHSAYVLFLNLVGKTFFYQGVVQKIRGQDEVGSQVNVHVTKSKNGEPVSLRFYLNSRHSNLLQGGSIEV
jgi:hypothetical protein